MAYTAFGSLSAAQKKLWANEVSKAGRDANFWMSNGFVGSNTADMTKPVHRITELTKTERGNTAVMQLVGDLRGDGIVGDNELTGNEEALVNDAIEIRVDQLRNGVRSKGRMSEQESTIRFRSVAKDTLAFWLADTLDELMFLTIAGRSYTLTSNGATRTASQLPQLSFGADVAAPTTNRRVFAGAATSTATLTAADKLNWNLIVRTVAVAKRKRLRPIRAGGKPWYALVCSTEQLRDLKLDPAYQAIVAKAGKQGIDNPLFTNSVANVEGVIIYDHQKVCNTLGAAGGSKWGAGSNIDGAQAQFLGAQALGLATIGEPDWEEADTNDYKNRPGVAYGRIFGLLKPQFKYSNIDELTREDFGTISVYTAAAA